jgi:hypothetical protein
MALSPRNLLGYTTREFVDYPMMRLIGDYSDYIISSIVGCLRLQSTIPAQKEFRASLLYSGKAPASTGWFKNESKTASRFFPSLMSGS